MINSDDILIQPRRGRREQPVPATGLLFANPSDVALANEILAEGGGEQRFIHNAALSVSKDQKLFVSGPAVGAPVAAMVLEKLIALGAQSIIMFGWCGAASPSLQIGDVLLGDAPVSGEGTSAYYPLAHQAAPSAFLLRRLQKELEPAGFTTHRGRVWSTDAPYRESRSQLKCLLKTQGVVAVDMEYSALCAVSCFRRVEFAALFLVSDELYGSKWRPGFGTPLFKQRRAELVSRLLSINLQQQGGDE